MNATGEDPEQQQKLRDLIGWVAQAPALKAAFDEQMGARSGYERALEGSLTSDLARAARVARAAEQVAHAERVLVKVGEAVYAKLAHALREHAERLAACERDIDGRQ